MLIVSFLQHSFRKQFLNKMWPIQLAFLLFIVCMIFLPSLIHVSLDLSDWSSSIPSTRFHNFPDISDITSAVSRSQHHTELCCKCSTLLHSSLSIWGLSPILFNLLYQGSSWSVWRLQNKKTSNSHCEICRWHCATGKGRSGTAGISVTEIGRCYGMVTNVGKYTIRKPSPV
jgi:hypothetical protein